MNMTRRREIKAVIVTLSALQTELECLESNVECIHDAEIDYVDNMPENLQGSKRYDKASNACDVLTTAWGDISDMKDNIDEIISALEEALQ